MKFTSSGNYRLMGGIKKPDAKFKTYVDEKYGEYLTGRRDPSGSSFATDWGNLAEEWLLVELLDPTYEPMHNKSLHSKVYDHFSGTPDYIRDKSIIGDIKSPQLKNFAKLSRCKTGNDLKETEPKYYWQLVSNYVLASETYKVTGCELFVFPPTEAQAREILNYNGDKANREVKEWEHPYFRKFEYVFDIYKELPVLGSKAKIKNPHVIEFVPPMEDVEFFKERLKLACNELNELIKQ